MNRSARTGAALAGVAGVIALASCGAVTVGASTDEEAPTESTGTETSETASAEPGYADGTYTAEGSYQTPETIETVSVTVTLEDDVVTAVEVTGDPQARESRQYQGQFIAGIADEVVGVDIDDLAVDRVAGSSLTSGGFNEAIKRIKQDAAA
jgi:uncharacterized protein with FMN-binding domain